jgi:cell division protein FtsI/penicillin-binding protein 2
LAIALRKAVGTEAVLADFDRYGFNRGNEKFWVGVDPEWKKRLAPQPANASITGLNDEEWSSALSIGETHLAISALQISRFLQAVGNQGLSCSPIALRTEKGLRPRSRELCADPARIMTETTTKQLMSAMLDTVMRGTASGISDTLQGTGWRIGGKTGTGGVPAAPLEKQDGWFAGLVFDSGLKARFTVATFVRHGGAGGGNAAEVSVEIARYLIDDSGVSSGTASFP